MSAKEIAKRNDVLRPMSLAENISILQERSKTIFTPWCFSYFWKAIFHLERGRTSEMN